MATRTWSDFTRGQQQAIVAAGVLETVLTVAALRDLARRDPSEIRGPRAVWALAVFVQPVGPVAYFARARR